jgi:hypothetical protein
VSVRQIHAPWTPRQIEKMARQQDNPNALPALCRKSHESDHATRVLTATIDGWRCPTCGYQQIWAWEYVS